MSSIAKPVDGEPEVASIPQSNTSQSSWPRRVKRRARPWEIQGYIDDHPPPNVGLAAELFMTAENIMHRAFYAPLDARYVRLDSAAEAVAWSRRAYAIFKRSLDLRRQITLGETHKMFELHDVLDSLRTALSEKAEFVGSWQGGYSFLAERRHPFFTLVTVWKAINKYLATSYLPDGRARTIPNGPRE